MTSISAGERHQRRRAHIGQRHDLGRTTKTGASGSAPAANRATSPCRSHDLASGRRRIRRRRPRSSHSAKRCPWSRKSSPREGPMAGGSAVTITGSELRRRQRGSLRRRGRELVHGRLPGRQSPPRRPPAPAPSTSRSRRPSGTSGAASADHFTYRTPPTVTKLSAKRGPATGGTMVTITGVGFTGATEVTFGGVRRRASPSPSTPRRSRGLARRDRRQPGHQGDAIGGTSAVEKKDEFRYSPVIESVSPPNGPRRAATPSRSAAWASPWAPTRSSSSSGRGSSKSGAVHELEQLLGPRSGREGAGTVDITARREQRQEHRRRGRSLHIRIGMRPPAGGD